MLILGSTRQWLHDYPNLGAHPLGVQKRDARTLSPDAQEALRKRAVATVLGGMKQYEVAQAFGVSAYIVSQWMKRFRADGEHALDAPIHRGRGPTPC